MIIVCIGNTHSPEKGHWCQECNKGYTTKQALVAHLKVKHSPAPTIEQLTCPISPKVFKVIKTMREHMASHKGPFHCRVKGCSAGLFLLPKRLNRHTDSQQGRSSGQHVLSVMVTCCILSFPVQTSYKKILVTCAVTPYSIFSIISVIEDLSKGCSFDGWPCKHLVACH